MLIVGSGSIDRVSPTYAVSLQEAPPSVIYRKPKKLLTNTLTTLGLHQVSVPECF